MDSGTQMMQSTIDNEDTLDSDCGDKQPNGTVGKIFGVVADFGRGITKITVDAGRTIAKGVKIVAKALAPVGYAFSKVYQAGYKFCYLIGVSSMRSFATIGRRSKKIALPVARGIGKAINKVIIQPVKTVTSKIASEVVHVAKGFAKVPNHVKQAFNRNIGFGIGAILALPFYAIRRHRKAIKTTFNILAPVAAVTILTLTIRHYATQDYALSLDYNGHNIGYITDEAVYDAAANMAYDRVINTDNSFNVTCAPKLTLQVLDKGELLDENAVCDEIIKSSGDKIASATGLYVEGQFQSAVQTKQDIENVLNDIIDQHRTKNAQDQKFEFVQDIKVVEGLYPVSSIKCCDELKQELTSVVDDVVEYTAKKGEDIEEVCEKFDMQSDDFVGMNKVVAKHIEEGEQVNVTQKRTLLQVKAISTVKETQSIPFEKKTEKDGKKYIGYDEITTKGENGVRENTIEVTTVDGKVISRKQLDTNIKVQPITQVRTVGDLKVNPKVEEGDGKAHKSFKWPLPGCYSISSPFGSRGRGYHTGMDITGSGGTYRRTIIAADGGTVKVAGWQRPGNRRFGYGQYVIIDHGNGYQTYYAHLDEIHVKAGQKVGQGQQLGLTGNTGRSYGAHLHFEVRYNGRPQNPYSYVINNK